MAPYYSSWRQTVGAFFMKFEANSENGSPTKRISRNFDIVKFDKTAAFISAKMAFSGYVNFDFSTSVFKSA